MICSHKRLSVVPLKDYVYPTAFDCDPSHIRYRPNSVRNTDARVGYVIIFGRPEGLLLPHARED
jgi:hypothetical protein